jgi:hypothetical protein
MGRTLAAHYALLAPLEDPDSGTTRFLNAHGVTGNSVRAQSGNAQ